MLPRPYVGTNPPRTLPCVPYSPNFHERSSLPQVTIRYPHANLAPFETWDDLERRAQEGDVTALNLVARITSTWNGNAYGGVEQSDEVAVDALSRAAQAGHIPSKADLAVYYVNGRAVPKDAQYANDLFREAAREGDAAAKLNLALSYAMGDGVGVDRDEALRFLKESAAAGNMVAEHWLGLCYHIGCGVQPSPEEAVRLFTSAANKGNAASQCMLGDLYERRPLLKSLHQAGALYLEAAIAGDVAAQCHIAELHVSGRGVAVNRGCAEYFFENAAYRGSAHAMYESGALILGSCAGNSSSAILTSDVQRAERLWAEAADKGHPYAQLGLARRYLAASRSDETYKRAFPLFLNAARNGEVLAQFTVALMYSQGKGVKADNVQAASWWNLAAEVSGLDMSFDDVRKFDTGGTSSSDCLSLEPLIRVANATNSGPAELLAGMAYELGVDVNVDSKMAEHYYHRAAGKGNAAAQYRLGCMYADDPTRGGKIEDPAEWLQRAADQGHAGAKEMLEYLARKRIGVESDDEVTDVWLRTAVPFSTTRRTVSGNPDDRNRRGSISEDTTFHKFLGYRNPNAMYRLGCHFAAGNQIERDPEAARFWWTKAALLGHPAAQKFLEWPIL